MFFADQEDWSMPAVRADVFCQPEGWLPPTGRVGGVSAAGADGYPTQWSMPIARVEADQEN
jgi:hypothetical protein